MITICYYVQLDPTSSTKLPNKKRKKQIEPSFLRRKFIMGLGYTSPKENIDRSCNAFIKI
jgi:hypothetical protein